jgi:anti-anti-sigma factor
VALTGELDIRALDALRGALDKAQLEADDTIPIDAAQMSFIDSTAISDLLRYHMVAAAQHRCLYFKSVSRPVATVLDFLDLEHILVDQRSLTAQSDPRPATCSP